MWSYPPTSSLQRQHALTMSVVPKSAAPMPRKRRAQSSIDYEETPSPSSKRRKVTNKSSPRKRRTKPTTTVDGTKDSQDNELWVVEAILAERKRGRGIQYKIKWEGNDPDTGEPWEDTWVSERQD